MFPLGICTFFNISKLMWCSGVAYICGQLEEGVCTSGLRYMCILLYMKLIWCSGVA